MKKALCGSKAKMKGRAKQIEDYVTYEVARSNTYRRKLEEWTFEREVLDDEMC